MKLCSLPLNMKVSLNKRLKLPGDNDHKFQAPIKLMKDGLQLSYKLELYHTIDLSTNLTKISIENTTDQDSLTKSIKLFGASFYLEIHKVYLNGTKICGSNRDYGITFGTGKTVENETCHNMSSHISRNLETFEMVLIYQDALLGLGIIEHHKKIDLNGNIIEWYQTSVIPDENIFFLSSIEIPTFPSQTTSLTHISSPTKISSQKPNVLNVIIAKCDTNDSTYFNLPSFTEFLGKGFSIFVDTMCNFIKESGIYQIEGKNGTIFEYTPIHVTKFQGAYMKTQLTYKMGSSFLTYHDEIYITILTFEQFYINFDEIYGIRKWELQASGNIKWRQINDQLKVTHLEINTTVTFDNTLLLQVKCPSQRDFFKYDTYNFTVFKHVYCFY